MKKYKSEITLIKNNRGCYIIDTVKGRGGVNEENPRGCYGDCYANNIASRYGFDFRNTVNRDFKRDTEQLYLFGFKDQRHENEIIEMIKKIDMPFVRVGEMGDPSQDWEHTLNICEIIAQAKKKIVIITKHWKSIPENFLPKLKNLDITINTSVSALDDTIDLDYRLGQYNRLKPYCNSVLRIVSCEFNLENEIGQIRSFIQEKLFMNENIINTVFRPNINNPLVTNKIIIVKKVKFLKSSVLASCFGDAVYFGDCKHCPDMCGVK